MCSCKVGRCDCGSTCKRCGCACDGVAPADAVKRQRGRPKAIREEESVAPVRKKRRASVVATQEILLLSADQSETVTKFNETQQQDPKTFPIIQTTDDLFDACGVEATSYYRRKRPKPGESTNTKSSSYQNLVNAALICCKTVCNLLASASQLCPQTLLNDVANKILNKNSKDKDEKEGKSSISKLEQSIFQAIESSPYRSDQRKLLQSVLAKGLTRTRISEIGTYTIYLYIHIYIS